MKNKPDCFDKKSFFPASYRLDVKEECVEFFEFFNTEEF
jgi:hypothetical protein